MLFLRLFKKNFIIKFILIISFFFFCFSSFTYAQSTSTPNSIGPSDSPYTGPPKEKKPPNKIIGIGGMVGSQAGLSLFLYNFEINVLYSYVGTQRVELTFDFFHPSFYIKFSHNIYLSFGTGIYVDFYLFPVLGEISYDYVGTGLRVPIVLSWFPNPNTEVFLEPAIGINFVPKLGFYGQINFGSRYFFPMYHPKKKKITLS